MDASMLYLIDDNPEVAKLVATWPVIGQRAVIDIGERGDEVKISPDDLTFWQAVSGVDEEDITRSLALLFHTGICDAGGKVDPLAQRYLNAKMMAKLPKSRQRRGGEDA